MGNYYYLIAGLADISLDDSKAPASVESLRAELYDALDAADRKVMDMLLMENDCRNLISMLRDGSVGADAPLGLLSAERMEELIAQVKADEAPAKDIPAFMYTFVQEWLNDSWREHAAFAEDRLWSLFYEYAMGSGNEFENTGVHPQGPRVTHQLEHAVGAFRPTRHIIAVLVDFPAVHL